MKKTRRRRRSWRWPLLLMLLVVSGVYAAAHTFIRAPEQRQEAPGLPQPADSAGQGAADLTKEETASLRSHQERKESFYTILVSGVDDGNGGSDTNILLAVDAAGGSIFGVSIPRDTKAQVNGKNCKINFAYNAGGMELLADTVSHQLGIPVDYTVLVDLKGFQALVDAIGGVDFYVPVNMNYDDPLQNLSIHISKGNHHLSGSEALKVVRFREGYASQDIGRMQTQQDFLKAVAKQTLTVGNLGKIGEFVKIFQKYVETDLTVGNLAWLGERAVSMGADAIEFATLPGEWKSPYIYLDQAEVLTLVNEHLNPYVEDRLPQDLNILS